MITFKRQWRKYKTCSSHEFNKNLERRLVTLGIAKYTESDRSILDTDIDRKQDLYDAGFTTVSKVIDSDITTVSGIGKVTAKRIKNELHNSK